MRGIFFGIFFLTVQAQADLLLEPYAGYFTGSFEGRYRSTSLDQKFEESGLAIGGRAGYVLPMGLWFAGDLFLAPEQDAKYSDSANGGGDRKSKRTMLFADVGFNLPAVPLRFWAGYALFNDWTTSSTNSATDWTGSSLKVGGGYSVIPLLLSINLEYMFHDMKKAKTSSSEVDIGTTYDGSKSSSIFLSISAPLSP